MSGRRQRTSDVGHRTFSLPVTCPRPQSHPMSDLLDRQLDRLHRQRRLQRTLDRFLPLLGAGVGAAALAVMVVRLGIPGADLVGLPPGAGGGRGIPGADWLGLPLAAAGVLLPLLAIPRAFARRDERVVLMGHLDRDCGAHGLAMALAAFPAAERDGDWMAA